MRVIEGTKLVEARPDWRETVEAHRRIVVDIGAGDGRFVYESARHESTAAFVAVDPDADSLSEYAFRASRKPARGGVANAFFVVAAVEDLPDQLHGIANVVRVNFPWGSLLRGLMRPDEPVLLGLSSLLRPAGCFELVMCYDPTHDLGAFPGERLPPLDGCYVEGVMAPAFEAAGLLIAKQRLMTRDEALALPSTWGRRLLHGRDRRVYFVTGGRLAAT